MEGRKKYLIGMFSCWGLMILNAIAANKFIDLAFPTPKKL